VQRFKHSAEHHRVTPKVGGGTGFGSIMLCAFNPCGGFRFTPPTLQTTTNKKEAERRQAHAFRCSAPYGRGSR
jgi:hypothetical protein